MATDIWPLAGLALETDRLQLRLPTEPELMAVVSLAPDDLATDPASPAPPGAKHPTPTAILQWYWRALGGWRPDHWRLPLAVWFQSDLVGFQELEAERFIALRTVETSSWLVPAARGLGIGKEMRAAVLALAFDHLGAAVATSSAWDSNVESLGVSRALGYTDNGWFVADHLGQAGRQQRVVLERAAWDPTPWPTTVTGLEPCRPWFELQA
ncbi:MAG TPA: GNAT family protein [Acidimicrobiales bacterium]|nr:GNAT family protein [Acidimicrobiales bacterium]